MKEQVVTFKVDRKLQQALNLIPNKSEFIRNAVLDALGTQCPLCGGTGVLNDDQRKHFDDFMENHSIHRCGECNQLHIKCKYEGDLND